MRSFIWPIKSWNELKPSSMRMIGFIWGRFNRSHMKSFNCGNRTKILSLAFCMTATSGALLVVSPYFSDFLYFIASFSIKLIFLLYFSFNCIVSTTKIKKLRKMNKIWKNQQTFNLLMLKLVWNDLWSRDDEVRVPLEPVIPGGAVGAIGFMNDFLGDFQQFFIGGSLMEPFLHSRLIKLFEAFHSWAVGHHDNAFHDLFLVLSDIFESEEE